jgi:hypothetical protein
MYDCATAISSRYAGRIHICSPLPCTLFFTHCILFDRLWRRTATAWYVSVAMCSRRTRTWWVGREISGGSEELEGGATVYIYSMQAFALAIVLHYTSF